MLLAEFDTTGRPLFLPVSNGLFNAAGVLEDVASQQIVGSIQTFPWSLIPTQQLRQDPVRHEQQGERHKPGKPTVPLLRPYPLCKPHIGNQATRKR
jgi:hypothetical protein